MLKMPFNKAQNSAFVKNSLGTLSILQMSDIKQNEITLSILNYFILFKILEYKLIWTVDYNIEMINSIFHLVG